MTEVEYVWDNPLPDPTVGWPFHSQKTNAWWILQATYNLGKRLVLLPILHPDDL